MQRLYSKFMAKLVLGVLFFIHLIDRYLFFWRKRKSLRDFWSHYASDAIAPVGTEERENFPSYQKCQVCSLCTFSCEAIIEGRAPSSFEPKYLLLGPGRSAHEAEYLFDDWLPCFECQRCTVECPNNVPIHAMADMIVERRKRFGFRS